MNDAASSQVQVARLEVKVAHLEIQLVTMSGKLDEVLEALHEAKGSWKALMWLGGASAALGSVVSYFISHLKFS
jgi:hypothetical protein